MEEAVGEPVGLGMGFQAGGLIGLYLGFSLATISVLTDAENIQRTVSLMCIPPFLFSLILGPFLARRKKPVILTKEPLIEAREKLSKFNEGQGKWRVLSHVSSDGVNLRIDMHNLDNIEGVVDAALEIAERTTVKFIVGRGNVKSSSPELRNRVLTRVEDSVEYSSCQFSYQHPGCAYQNLACLWTFFDSNHKIDHLYPKVQCYHHRKKHI
ncbi:MAG: hypothetical protein CM15mP47_0930 [Methanobacteriota archaeon]|nr:MAG: hypothetical protein CM15mP47_0930 [Euryarchaeota archaeon]